MTVKDLKEALEEIPNDFILTCCVNYQLHHVVDANTFSRTFEFKVGEKLDVDELLSLQ